MKNNFNLRQQIDKVNDPEILKSTLFALLTKIDSLEKRLGEQSEGNDSKKALILEKKDKLERIRFGLSELNERMERPYVISVELQAVKEVLDILAETGDCNSVILEGEPGTGKTQWAYSEVGQELREGKDVELIHVRIKDTMRAQDLLYSIDDVRRLSDAQAKAQVPEEIKNEAGIWKHKIINGEIQPEADAEYKSFKLKMEAIIELGETAKDLDYLNYVDLGQLGEAIYQSGKGKKVYLLIDEIEKGREELMTGILDEIENLNFTISETGTIIEGDKKNLRIIITTNTEDSDKIPPSFRRRSLYHYIDYPDRSDMAQIVELNFPDIQEELLDYALNVFYEYHENQEIQKKPSTPELLSWIRVLLKDYEGKIPQDIPHREKLLKYQDDQKVEINNINNSNIRNKIEQDVPLYVRKALKGEKIFHLKDDLNYSPSAFQDFFAGLLNNGVDFITPKVDEDGNSKNDFQLIAPGVSYLGDGYYILTDKIIDLIHESSRFDQQIIDKQVEVLPPGQKFEEITKRNDKVTEGIVKYDETKEGHYRTGEAYMVKNGTVVINKPYKEKDRLFEDKFYDLAASFDFSADWGKKEDVVKVQNNIDIILNNLSHNEETNRGILDRLGTNMTQDEISEREGDLKKFKEYLTQFIRLHYWS